MSKKKAPTLRVACGRPDEPFSSVWRIWAGREGDVYIAWSKTTAGLMKLSLHASGIWRYAATAESGITVGPDEDRVFRRFDRPKEHRKGVVRGPSILVPLTAAGSRTVYEVDLSGEIHWYRAPSNDGRMVEFSLYFLEPDAPRTWSEHETILGSLSLPEGRSLYVIGGSLPIPEGLDKEFERHISQNLKVMADLNDFAGGSRIWVLTSNDEMAIPLLVDLPAVAMCFATGQRSARGTPAQGRTLTVDLWNKQIN